MFLFNVLTKTRCKTFKTFSYQKKINEILTTTLRRYDTWNLPNEWASVLLLQPEKSSDVLPVFYNSSLYKVSANEKPKCAWNVMLNKSKKSKLCEQKSCKACRNLTISKDFYGWRCKRFMWCLITHGLTERRIQSDTWCAYDFWEIWILMNING